MIIPIIEAVMAVAKMIVTTIPDVVILLTRRRHTPLPALSVWQMTPEAQTTVGVIVGMHVVVLEPEMEEQKLVVTIDVVEHCSVEVVLLVSVAAVIDAVVASLVVDDSFVAVDAAVAVDATVAVDAAVAVVDSSVEVAGVVLADAVEGAVVAAAVVGSAEADVADFWALSELV